MYFRALRHTNERTGVLQWGSCLSEHINRHRHPIVSLGVPFTLPDLKLNGQYAVVKIARWPMVVIDCDHGKRLCQETGRGKYTAREKEVPTYGDPKGAAHRLS